MKSGKSSLIMPQTPSEWWTAAERCTGARHATEPATYLSWPCPTAGESSGRPRAGGNRRRWQPRTVTALGDACVTCHCEEHSDVAISMRLKTRRRTAVATATRLPRYARNDTVGTLAMSKCAHMSGPGTTTVAAMPSWVMACAGSTVSRRLCEGQQRQRGCTTTQKRAGC